MSLQSEGENDDDEDDDEDVDNDDNDDYYIAAYAGNNVGPSRNQLE